MGKRTVLIYPKINYEFKENNFYKQEWDFLPDKSQVAIIATQLTYLEFHEWIHKNIRTTTDVSDSSTYCKLHGDINEGFVRTDILLYGTICETAI